MSTNVENKKNVGNANIHGVSHSFYEYGAMSSKYRIKAENKLTAYATMCLHYQSNAHMLVIYSPKEAEKDSWTNVTGQISNRLDEIFGGKDAFDKYLQEHQKEIKECYDSIEQIV